MYVNILLNEDFVVEKLHFFIKFLGLWTILSFEYSSLGSKI